jgi:hypothetical protein
MIKKLINQPYAPKWQQAPPQMGAKRNKNWLSEIYLPGF